MTSFHTAAHTTSPQTSSVYWTRRNKKPSTYTLQQLVFGSLLAINRPLQSTGSCGCWFKTCHVVPAGCASTKALDSELSVEIQLIRQSFITFKGQGKGEGWFVVWICLDWVCLVSFFFFGVVCFLGWVSGVFLDFALFFVSFRWCSSFVFFWIG